MRLTFNGAAQEVRGWCPADLLPDRCRQGKLPHLQAFVDSPRTNKVADISWQHIEFLDDELGWSVEAPSPGSNVDL